MEKILKTLLVGTLILFALTVTIGVQMTMGEGMHGGMSDCPFMAGSSSMCDMDALQHIAQWKQLFSAVPYSEGTALGLLIALIGFALVSIFIAKILRKTEEYIRQKVHYRKKENPETALFDYFKLALADGIIHRRVYA